MVSQLSINTRGEASLATGVHIQQLMFSTTTHLHPIGGGREMDTSCLNIAFPGANQLIREKYSDELEEAELEMVRDGSNSEKAVLFVPTPPLFLAHDALTE